VDVSVARADQVVEVAVADRGPGIPSQDVEQIFEPFYRSGDRRGVPGSGLGLAIARGLATANGCELSVISTIGQGSRFALTLPVPAGQPPR
jgi:two-component system sensor histidine kinase KdpD